MFIIGRRNKVRILTSPGLHYSVRIPVLFAKLIKYFILFPLYELAKAIVGDKIVGVVKRKVNYYADAAEWYVDELISMNPIGNDNRRTIPSFYLYNELSDVKAKT